MYHIWKAFYRPLNNFWACGGVLSPRSLRMTVPGNWYRTPRELIAHFLPLVARERGGWTLKCYFSCHSGRVLVSLMGSKSSPQNLAETGSAKNTTWIPWTLLLFVPKLMWRAIHQHSPQRSSLSWGASDPPMDLVKSKCSCSGFTAREFCFGKSGTSQGLCFFLSKWGEESQLWHLFPTLV